MHTATIQDEFAFAPTMTGDGARALAERVAVLERELAAQREAMRREADERQRQFALMLDEICKAVDKLERCDLKLEKSLRAELTRQNRFIYEEFQSRMGRLNALVADEARAPARGRVAGARAPGGGALVL